LKTTPLEGNWELVRAELDGEAAPELLTMKTVLQLGGDTYIVRFDGKISDRGKYELGGTKEVRTIIIHGVKGPNAGRTIPCIYQHVGDRLRVCYGLGGVTPTEFKTAAGEKRYLATYRRTAVERVRKK
jgi:uncharacterized protein (TIGR03067 family)